MRSMTGYGHGKSVMAGRQITVELSSVNRKQVEIALSLPRGLIELEPRLRDEINTQISRGRLTVVVALHSGRGRHAPPHVDFDAARAYYKSLRKLQADLGLRDSITIETVLRGPGVVTEESAELDPESVWKPLHEALWRALKQLLRMRRREGRALAADLRGRMKVLQHEVAAIAKLAPRVMEKHREGLFARASKAGIAIEPGDERLLKEIVFFADRSDISEELTRIKSHFDQFTALLDRDEPVGRTLDFIIQEMNREINTIGGKANELAISQSVVKVKTELEKIREQVQNIE